MSRELWLEVSNVRFITDDSTRLEVQVKGALADAENESWWEVKAKPKDVGPYFKTVTEALDKKRRAFVRLAVVNERIEVDALRLDYGV